MEKLAVVGIGCRLPGAASPRQFWSLLLQGEDVISEVPPDRWDLGRYYDPTPQTPGRMYTRWGGFLNQVDHFDAAFFGITPKEAERMDPQQRLILEVAWESLEEAGISATAIEGSRAGVFLGMGNYDYGRLLARNIEAINAYDGLGNTLCIAANRLSYFLNLKGPSLVVETACSSSLVSLHYACRSLASRETDLCLVGGVSLMLGPEPTISYSNARMMSATGRCRTFDAEADGYVRGEGCGMVVLKRLDDALAAGDNIHAVILGSAVNQDGRSNGLAAPNGFAQQEVIRQALHDADLEPPDVTYVEAHGTGTVLGDPLEFEALQKVYGVGREPGNTCVIGALKTNIGHLEAAAGIAGLIKVVLMLQHRCIPANLHLKTVNPYIDLSASTLRIPTRSETWVPRQGAWRAGISSFGFGGTNAHFLLEAAPEVSASVGVPAVEHPDSEVFVLSGRSQAAMEANRVAFLEDWEHWSRHNLRDVCATAARGRTHFPHRLAWVVETPEQLREQLRQPLAATDVPQARRTARPPRVAFLFSGQGSQYPGMGRDLYAREEVFRATIDRCEAILADHLELPLRQVLFADPGTAEASLLNQTRYTQPALFALEYALAQQWLHWGVTPSLLVGHSLGEYVAATLAEVFSLEDALHLVNERGRLIQSIPPGGAMEALWADPETVAAEIGPWEAELSIATINGDAACVISGSRRAVDAVAQEMRSRGITSRPLEVSHAFHSPQMEEIADAFAALAAGIAYHPPKLPILSNLTGELADEAMATPTYWCRHLREPVQFRSALEHLRAQNFPLLLEIGPKATLLGLASSHYGEQNGDLVPLASLHPKRSGRLQMLSSLAILHRRGVPVRWESLYPDSTYQRLSLPTYRFQRERFWMETGPEATPPGPISPPTSDGGAGSLSELLRRGDRSELARYLRSLVPEAVVPGDAIDALTQALLAPPAGRDSSTGSPLPDTYRTEWVVAPPPGNAAVESSPRTWILVAEPGEGASLLARLLEEAGHRVLPLLLPDLHSTSVAAPLRESLEGAVPDGPVEILFLACPAARAQLEPAEEDRPDREVDRLLPLVLSLLEGCAATEGGERSRLWLVTRQGVAAAEAEGVDPAQASLWGFAKVLGLEQPGLLAAIIDLPDSSASGWVEPLVATLRSDPPESLLALRPGGLRVPRLRPLRVDVTDAPAFSPAHSYLITGGLGSLGLDLAEWIAGQGAGALVLVSRGQADGLQQERLERIRAGGTRVRTVSLDVGDRPGLSGLIQEIQASAFPLRGVFHCAGTTTVRELRDLGWDEWTQVLRPKVRGTWNLHVCTADVPLDWFVAFSSIAAVWGSRGQAHYAVANAFLDGVIERRRLGGLPALTINWGPWEGQGMASDSLRELLERMGLRPLSRSDGFRALASLMTGDQSGVTVARLDAARFREIFEFKATTGLFRELAAEGTPQRSEAGSPAVTEAPALREELERLRPEQREIHLLSLLRKEVAALLGFADPGELDPEANLFDLGVDSLMAMDIVGLVRKRLTADFTYLEMVNDASLRGIVRLILRAIDPDSAPPPSQEEGVNLQREARLDEEIRPAQMHPAQIHPEPPWQRPRSILLTGGSGFLGAYLLRDLLLHTDARLYCLVRASEEAQGRERIVANLRRYGLWQEAFAQRIIPVHGDLSVERFGLEEDRYANLCGSIDTIYQSAAVLNFVFPYSRLRASNVQGTESILRFACQGPTKSLHYISTDAVYDSSRYYDRTVTETEPIDHTEGVDLGYTQTKWVSERLVTIARERGLPVSIYRPPLITGDSREGYWNTEDFTCLFLKGCVQMGMIPDIASRVTFVPVDYVSRAVTALSLDPTAQGRNYHLTNPAGPTWTQVGGWIDALGHRLKIVSYGAWEQQLRKEAEGGDNVLIPLLPFFLRRWSERGLSFAGLAEHRVRLDPSATLAALRPHGIDCPVVDQTLISTYIRYFESCGFLANPRALTG